MNILKLFDTLTRIKKEIIPADNKEIKLYTCGPTVYNYAHIGNFRTYLFEDLLKRTLLFCGYKVKQVMNITDIDDKTIKGAIAKNLSLKDYTTTYKEAFFEDLKTLKILPAEAYPEATQYIKEMILIIEDLLKKQVAYKGQDGSIYFSIKQFPSYGKLSHLNLKELKEGASQRVASDEYEKENASDFVLWKAYEEKRDGKIFWDSPFGKGRPGWHIECSAMALKLLGETIDLHCGGVDNIFPHHENEIAQSEAYTKKPFVKCWVHSEHLVVENKKMSKSLGNFYTLRDLINKGYQADQIRYLLLQVHYRSPLNFTFEGLDAAKNTLQRIFDFITRLKNINQTEGNNLALAFIDQTKLSFTQALTDDLNISAALAKLFDFIREINSLCDENNLSEKEAQAILKFLENINEVLAFIPLKEEIKVPQEMKELLLKREEARGKKDFKQADEIRDLILSKGFIIEDTPQGPTLKKK